MSFWTNPFGIKVKASNIQSVSDVPREKSKFGASVNSDDSFFNNINNPPHNDEFKAYIPNFLYKPPFGYPLNKNVLVLKELAKNPFIFSVIRTLKDEASTTKWEIKLRKENSDDKFTGEWDSEVKRISNWFYNPNGNSESINEIIGKWIVDLCEVDAAVGVKVFNKKGEFSQLFARDGGSFLQNPDIYGYMGDRDEFVYPYKTTNPNMQMPYTIKVYGAQYSESAAYFQYGWTGNALPVPFGRREIMYIMSNPRTDSIYGRSPLEIIQDVLLTLVYGTRYNLDFYLNGNMPDGIVHIMGADNDIAKAFQDRLTNKFKQNDSIGNSVRTGHTYPVWGGPEVNFVPFQLSAKDMEIIEQQKWFTKLVWSAFGVTPDQMGYTEDSNKSTGQTQTSVYKKKALTPLLRKIEYFINTQLMPELDASGKLEFKFEDFDMDEEFKKNTLYKLQIDMGIKTPLMVAEEEGIDIAKLKEHLAEEREQKIDEMKQTNPNFMNPGFADVSNPVNKEKTKTPEVKSIIENGVELKNIYLKMDLDELISEHEKLVKILEEDNPEKIKKEAKDQKEELESYIAKKKQEVGVKAESDLVDYFKDVKKELMERLKNEPRT